MLYSRDGEPMARVRLYSDLAFNFRETFEWKKIFKLYEVYNEILLWKLQFL